MQAQGTSTPSHDDAVTDGMVMAMLLADDAQRPWTPDEIAREYGDHLAITDSLQRSRASSWRGRTGRSARRARGTESVRNG
jgi:hypothetical protein